MGSTRAGWAWVLILVAILAAPASVARGQDAPPAGERSSILLVGAVDYAADAGAPDATSASRVVTSPKAGEGRRPPYEWAAFVLSGDWR